MLSQNSDCWSHSSYNLITDIENLAPWTEADLAMEDIDIFVVDTFVFGIDFGSYYMFNEIEVTGNFPDIIIWNFGFGNFGIYDLIYVHVNNFVGITIIMEYFIDFVVGIIHNLSSNP